MNGGKLEEIDWEKEEAQFMSILKRAEEITRNRDKWNCEGKSRWGLFKNNKKYPVDINTIIDTSWKSKKDKVYYCGVPKVIVKIN